MLSSSLSTLTLAKVLRMAYLRFVLGLNYKYERRTENQPLLTMRGMNYLSFLVAFANTRLWLWWPNRYEVSHVSPRVKFVIAEAKIVMNWRTLNDLHTRYTGSSDHECDVPLISSPSVFQSLVSQQNIPDLEPSSRHFSIYNQSLTIRRVCGARL